MPDGPRRPLLRTVLLVVAAVLVVALVVVVASGIILWRRPLPAFGGQAEIDGLRADVEIVRDAQGVPQIFADDARDLFRAQGYVHAQDRFFQMDYRRHVASGRLAELIGDEDGAVESDVVARTLGWRAAAEAELERLGATAQDYLAAYAAGVNDYVSRREASRLGVEYTVLGLTRDLAAVEPWTEVDSLVWLKALAWDLSDSYELELERSAIYRVIGDVARVEELFPDYPYDLHDPIVGPGASGSVRAAAGVRATPGGTSAPDVPDVPDVPGVLGVIGGQAGEHLLTEVGLTLRAVPSLVGRGPGIGSSSWAVAGERTATGAPVLAGDSHMAATIPGPWHQVGLRCRDVGPDCPFDVAGFGLAGIPGVFSGHGASLAWAATSMPADVTDLFVERVFPDGTYLRDGERVELSRRTETIRVNGADDVEIEIESTVHGPLLSGVLPELGNVRLAPLPGQEEETLRGLSVAVASAIAQPGTTMEGIFALNAATEPADVTAAAGLIGAPALNVVYATTAGDIGYEAAALVPQRTTVGGEPPSDGRWPRPGWDTRYDWQGFVAPRDLPGAVNPAAGYVVAANQAVQPAGSGPDLGHAWDPGYRSQRIASLVEEEAGEAGHTVESTQAVQGDVLDATATVLMPFLVTIDVDDEFVGEAFDLLIGWDLEQAADSAAAAYFAAVWANVLRLTFWDDLPEGFEPDGGSRWTEVVRRLLDDPQSPWWDDRTTINVVESRDLVLTEALTSARLQLTVSLGKDASSWSWSKLHEVALRHPVLGSDAFGAPVNALVNPAPLPVDGGQSSVWATSWDAADWPTEFPTYDVDTLPAMRFVVDLADLDASTWVNLAGSSGHPASRHYADQIGAWADRRTYPWLFTPERVRDAARDTRTLHPVDQ